MEFPFQEEMARLSAETAEAAERVAKATARRNEARGRLDQVERRSEAINESLRLLHELAGETERTIPQTVLWEVELRLDRLAAEQAELEGDLLELEGEVEELKDALRWARRLVDILNL